MYGSFLELFTDPSTYFIQKHFSQEKRYIGFNFERSILTSKNPPRILVRLFFYTYYIISTHTAHDPFAISYLLIRTVFDSVSFFDISTSMFLSVYYTAAH